jgi:hypothetical protein
MRGFDCPCGEYVEVENDQLLMRRMREHADRDHAADSFTDAQLRQMAETGAYDVRPEPTA